jgi:hypothetical protein
MTQVTGKKKEDEHNGAGEDNANEAFGQDAERDDYGDSPTGEKRRPFGLPAVEKEIQGDPDPKPYGDIRNEDASEEIRAARGQENNGGPETRLRCEEAAAKEIEQEGEREDAEMEGEAGAPGVDAKELDSEGDAPVRKGGFLEVADIVFVEGDPVVTDKNFAAGVGVGGIDVVL